MQQIITALWPVFALLMLGAWARRSDFPGEGFWQPAERATYYVLFPALLVERLAQARLGGDASLLLVSAVLGLLLAGTVVCLLSKPLLKLGAASYTSFFQGSMRFNTYVALAITAALFADAGIVYAAVITAVMVPLLNLLCILVFATTASEKPSWRRVIRTLLANPLILACLLGIGLSLLEWPLPEVLTSVLELLSRMALPLGLLAVGAGLNLRALRHGGRALVASSLVKLLLLPLLALSLAGGLGFDTTMTGVLVVFASVPTATSAYILARQLGGDAELMAAIITAQTLLSMLTLPVALMLI
ncbi:AEC family transporter [Marinobacterium sediminicola]|uniref:AEC family transporter n=1 Tax=Marinobacterium sediminicola TaxID=518898 RepID=A0ABY1RZL8_9GAMM|nr:AEC family transporter [Marinobacterium sediminicola]ULG69066.1 AEC family transporter [Marinobacterium sediminicola]SMR73657.1 hypothetical protein SAMN04487964_105133 [Marinobacterium sediminicola]